MLPVRPVEHRGLANKKNLIMTPRRTMIPKLNGPWTNFVPPTNRAIIGVANARYWQTTDIVNTAVIASGPANESKPNNSARKAQKHTAWIGVCVRGFMLYKNPENGRPQSREKANI